MGERLRSFTVIEGIIDDANIVYSPSNGLISQLLMSAIRTVGGEYSANPDRYGLMYHKKWLREDKTLSFYGLSNSEGIEVRLERKLRVFKIKTSNCAQRSTLVDITLSARELCHDFCKRLIGYKHPSYEYGLQVENGVFLQPHLALWEQLPEEKIIEHSKIFLVRRFEELMVNPIQIEDLEVPFQEAKKIALGPSSLASQHEATCFASLLLHITSSDIIQTHSIDKVSLEQVLPEHFQKRYMELEPSIREELIKLKGTSIPDAKFRFFDVLKSSCWWKLSPFIAKWNGQDTLVIGKPGIVHIFDASTKEVLLSKSVSGTRHMDHKGVLSLSLRDPPRGIDLELLEGSGCLESYIMTKQASRYGTQEKLIAWNIPTAIRCLTLEHDEWELKLLKEPIEDGVKHSPYIVNLHQLFSELSPDKWMEFQFHTMAAHISETFSNIWEKLSDQPVERNAVQYLLQQTIQFVEHFSPQQLDYVLSKRIKLVLICNALMDMKEPIAESSWKLLRRLAEVVSRNASSIVFNLPQTDLMVESLKTHRDDLMEQINLFGSHCLSQNVKILLQHTIKGFYAFIVDMKTKYPNISEFLFATTQESLVQLLSSLDVMCYRIGKLAVLGSQILQLIEIQDLPTITQCVYLAAEVLGPHETDVLQEFTTAVMVLETENWDLMRDQAKRLFCRKKIPWQVQKLLLLGMLKNEDNPLCYWRWIPIEVMSMVLSYW